MRKFGESAIYNYNRKDGFLPRNTQMVNGGLEKWKTKKSGKFGTTKICGNWGFAKFDGHCSVLKKVKRTRNKKKLVKKVYKQKNPKFVYYYFL